MESLESLMDGRILVECGDLTTFGGGAIVNAANSTLLGGGGVDGAIHDAGGPDILAACRELRGTELPGGLPQGRAVSTVAGRLSVRRVIHTVGPVWRGGGYGEAAVLASCYLESLRIAAEEGLESVAFPAVSTGAYGYPKELAATVAWKATAVFLGSNEIPRTVVFVFYSPRDAAIFLESIRKG